MNKCRWGIVSTGRMAGVFARAVAAEAYRGTVAAIASRFPGQADALAGEFSGVVPHGSYQELLENPVSVTGAATLAGNGVDLVAAGTLEFESGLLAEVSVAVTATLGQRLEIIGSKGTLEVPHPWTASHRLEPAVMFLRRPKFEVEEFIFEVERSPFAMTAF